MVEQTNNFLVNFYVENVLNVQHFVKTRTKQRCFTDFFWWFIVWSIKISPFSHSLCCDSDISWFRYFIQHRPYVSVASRQQCDSHTQKTGTKRNSMQVRKVTEKEQPMIEGKFGGGCVWQIVDWMSSSFLVTFCTFKAALKNGLSNQTETTAQKYEKNPLGQWHSLLSLFTTVKWSSQRLNIQNCFPVNSTQSYWSWRCARKCNETDLNFFHTWNELNDTDRILFRDISDQHTLPLDWQYLLGIRGDVTQHWTPRFWSSLGLFEQDSVRLSPRRRFYFQRGDRKQASAWRSSAPTVTFLRDTVR